MISLLRDILYKLERTEFVNNSDILSKRVSFCVIRNRDNSIASLASRLAKTQLKVLRNVKMLTTTHLTLFEIEENYIR